MAVKLRVRETPTSKWIENFSNFGWKVRAPDNSRWIQMNRSNTKIRSADNSQWLPVQ